MSDDDHDWVAHLLGATATPTMPEEVADRLDRTLRLNLSGSVADRSVSDSPPQHDQAVPAETAPPLSSETVPPPSPDTGADDRSTASGRPVPPTSRPALVPPAVGSGTGEVPALRATAVSSDDDGTGATRARSGRSWGSSRREQRAENQAEHRRRLLTRWAPVAAGVLVLGGAGITAVNLAGGQDSSTAESQQDAAAGAAEVVVPRPLVATGIEYQTADREVFDEQVRALVAVAGSGDSEESSALAAPEEATGEAVGGGGQDSADDGAEPQRESSAAGTTPLDPGAARGQVTASPLADPAAFQECVEQVTDVAGGSAAAMDLAVVDGVESTVVVVPDATGESLFVYVVGPDCAVSDSQFQFFTVTP